MHETSALVVVDMQAVFQAATNQKVIEGVSREILKCIAQEMPIIFLEYQQSGDTLPELLKLVQGYTHAFRVRKSSDDGSAAVSKLMKSKGLPHRHIMVCGVNTDACVRKTAAGLCKRYRTAKVSVLKHACGTNGVVGHYDWNSYITLRNFSLV